MKRGEKESFCLEKVKMEMFSDLTNDALNENPHYNLDFDKNYFGLLEDERAEFVNIIREAKPNPSSSEFPDFIFADGFIEHFQITSSRHTHKGATHTKKESEFQRRVDTETKKLEEEWNKKPCFDSIRSESWAFQNPEHSHAFLMSSFKDSWEKHLESRKKFTGKKEIGIFMVEYPEVALAMCENVYCNWIDGMSQGDMREQEEFKEYRLSRDKELLTYIYGFRNEIKYVIFINLTRCEIIRTESIPYLLKLMPWDYAIYPMQVCTLATVQNISVPNPFVKGEEKRDKT